jgi:hypothetical protein
MNVADQRGSSALVIPSDFGRGGERHFNTEDTEEEAVTEKISCAFGATASGLSGSAARSAHLFSL